MKKILALSAATLIARFSMRALRCLTILKSNSALLLPLVLAGCATSMPDSKVASTLLPNGFWEGAIRIGNMTGQDINPGPHGVRIVTCDGNARVWLIDSKGGPAYTPPITFKVTSLIGTHVISKFDAAKKQPDWVEIQTWVLSELNSKSAAMHWSRSVNNRDVDQAQANRTFAEFGLGTMRRVRETCTAADLLPTASHGDKLAN
jgi:hypothetical protein